MSRISNLRLIVAFTLVIFATGAQAWAIPAGVYVSQTGRGTNATLAAAGVLYSGVFRFDFDGNLQQAYQRPDWEITDDHGLKNPLQHPDGTTLLTTDTFDHGFTDSKRTPARPTATT